MSVYVSFLQYRVFSVVNKINPNSALLRIFEAGQILQTLINTIIYSRD